MSTKKKKEQTVKVTLPQVDLSAEKRDAYRMRARDWMNQSKKLLDAEMNAQKACIDAMVEAGVEVKHQLRGITKSELGAMAKVNSAFIELWGLAACANVTNDATRTKLVKDLQDMNARIAGMASGEIHPMSSEEQEAAEAEAAAIQADLEAIQAKLAAAKAKLGSN